MTAAVPYDAFRFDAPHAAVLDGVIAAVKAATAPKVVVFDLDSTLFDNRPRQVHILREYGLKHGVPELFRLEREHFRDWDLVEPLVRMGMDREKAQSIHAPMKQYWRETFFTSPYCLYDVAFPGAKEYVQEIYALGAHVVYLTGRHEDMRAGTAESLRRFSFPVPGELNVSLLMKPRFDIPDTDYKISAYAHMRTLGPVIAGFDNEPAHANALKVGFPEARIVWLRTDRSPALDEPRADLLPIWGFVRA